MNFEHLYEQFKGKKQHGIVCPLFFLQTENSSQIGEYPDLKNLGDFAKSCGFSIIQLLPIFDTGPESSPYSARSCYALNPIYISLKLLPGIDTEDPDYKELYMGDGFSFFDYYAIYTLKMNVFKRYVSKNQSRLSKLPDFLKFCENNPWLDAYAAFCVYKDETDLPPEVWEIEKEEIIQKHPDEVFFHKALQYFAHEQFLDAKKYIAHLGLEFMGDIPILLSPDSVEMWTHRSLFDFQLTVGAAPDQFTTEGQSWGFPMIRFIAKPQACAGFWRSRIDHLSQYFSLYRIDHAVGFFRLWIIPKGKKAKQGFFFPASDEMALETAKNLFDQLFKNTPMIPIAEDLGVIPDYVKKFISDSKLCGTKVVRWERYWNEGGDFIPFSKYPHFSMTTLSTHDTTFNFDEWSKDIVGAKGLSKLLNIPYSANFTPLMQEHILKHVHQSESLFIINMIQEYLYLHPGFKDKLDRVNDPASSEKPNWSTKMCIPIEKLIQDVAFCKKIKSILIKHD